MMKPHRNQPLWFAYMAHRLSGLGLAIFLPFHFLVLGLALEGEAEMDGFLKWSENPLVKLAETGLVGLLALHLFGGLRLLALEFLPWSSRQKSYAAAALAGSCCFSLLFFMKAI